MGDRSYAAATARWVAQTLEVQGRVDEAEEWLATADGFDTVFQELGLRAQLMARRGQLDEAERLARAALDGGEEYPVPQFQDPRFTLAEILGRAGRSREAREHAEVCLRRYEAKGIAPLIEKARALILDLDGVPPARTG